MLKSKKPFQPAGLLQDFSLMCKNNTEWQGDGWGAAWRLDNRSWIVDKSLKPIWEDMEKGKDSRSAILTESTIFIVHARGASFPNQKGDIDFNQPYIDGDLCFVFNGELYGVSIQTEGTIGAQKIFGLLKKNLQVGTADLLSLQNIQDLLTKKSKKILGCNIAFCVDDNFYVSCYFGDKKEYYTVRYYSNKHLSIICSEKIGNFPWRDMKKGEILKL